MLVSMQLLMFTRLAVCSRCEKAAETMIHHNRPLLSLFQSQLENYSLALLTYQGCGKC